MKAVNLSVLVSVALVEVRAELVVARIVPSVPLAGKPFLPYNLIVHVSAKLTGGVAKPAFGRPKR